MGKDHLTGKIVHGIALTAEDGGGGMDKRERQIRIYYKIRDR